MARALRRSGEDAKWRELDRILDDPLVFDPGRDVRRKIVVFTEARDTLEYLARRIRDRTGESQSVAVIHGSVPRDRRRATIAAFNDDPAVRFLLANDAAGEGVNLQRGTHPMVNYDLPWNPNRLEQRFGRIHRIGQTEVCHLWNLVASETREGAVYRRSFRLLRPHLTRHGIRTRRNSPQESAGGLEPQEADRGIAAPRRHQPGIRAGEVDSARPSLDPAPVVGKAAARGVPGGAVRAARGQSVGVAGGVPDRDRPEAGTGGVARNHRRDGAVGGDPRPATRDPRPANHES